MKTSIAASIVKSKKLDAGHGVRMACLHSPGSLAIKKVLLPTPGAGEVLIRMEGCGMCASSLPKWEGREWFNYPLQPGDPGHEGYGYIEAVGSGVKDLSPGLRVAALSYHALGEYDVAKATEVDTLPDELSGMPFPGEPLSCAINVFRRSDIQEGQTVAIVGAGFLGCLLIQLARKKGARIIAISRRPFSLEIAAAMGADETILLDENWKVASRVMELTGGQLCERVIEATGKARPLILAGELAAIRGRLVIAGYHQDGFRNINVQQWNWKGLDVINAHERDPQQYITGMKAAVEATLAGDLKFLPLLTHRFSLDEIDKAFEMLAKRPDGFVKAIIKMG